MPETGTSSSMSEDGKRSDGLRPQATAPILDSTSADLKRIVANVCFAGNSGSQNKAGGDKGELNLVKIRAWCLERLWRSGVRFKKCRAGSCRGACCNNAS